MGGMFSSSSKSSSKDEVVCNFDDKVLNQKMCLDDCGKKFGKLPQNNAALYSLYGGGKKRKSTFRKSFTKTKGTKGKATRKRLK